MDWLSEKKVRVLYDDPYLMVCEKPAGMPTQPDNTGDEDLLSWTRAYQKENGDRFSAELVHRLDRSTGGAVVLAKGSGMAAKLSAMLAERKIQKEYLAVVSGLWMEKSGRLEDYLVHDRKANIGHVSGPNDKNAKWAALDYQVLGTAETNTLLRVRLETGRTHQIRIQMAHRGHPLCGDGKYGSVQKGPLALWASGLSFPHPMNRKETVSVVSHPGTEGFFALFPENLWKEERHEQRGL